MFLNFFFEVVCMSDKHNMRRGVAALLSVLSVGGAASAEKGLSKSQNLRISNSNKVNLKKGGGKKRLSSSQNFSSERPNLSKKGNALNKSNVVSEGPKVQLNGNMGNFEHITAGVGGLYGQFRELSASQQAFIAFGIFETISAVTTGKGVAENALNLTLNRFIDLAREKIFKGPGEGKVNEFYAARDMAEDAVVARFGPIASVFARFAFYLKDSWVDPFVAFVKGLQGEKFSKLVEGYNAAVDGDMGNLVKITFKQFEGFFSKGAWGKAQIVAWWHVVSNGFKPNSLNMWFYELGAKISGNDVTGSMEAPETTLITENDC